MLSISYINKFYYKPELFLCLILWAYRNSLTLDASVGRWTLVVGLPWTLTLDAGLWTLDSGHSSLDPELWTLDTVVEWLKTESEPSF